VVGHRDVHPSATAVPHERRVGAPNGGGSGTELHSSRPDRERAVSRLDRRARACDAPVVDWVPAVIVAVVRDGKLLALRRSHRKAVGAGRWESVSGTIEAGEAPLEAARREAREETGLDVTITPRPIDAYVAPVGERWMLAVVYRGDAPPGDVHLSDEHDDAAWLSPDEIAERGSWPRLVEALARALA
jgi:8-oxo-dGTP diphosphatase